MNNNLFINSLLTDYNFQFYILIVLIIILYTIYKIVKVISNSIASKYRYDKLSKDIDEILDIIRQMNEEGN